MKILLIDDSEDAHTLFRLFLKGISCEIVSAYSADEGLALYQKESKPFSFIFLDQVMPEKDGAQAAREIRAFEGARGLPPVRLIALTGLTEPNEIERAKKAGCDEVWAKPISKEKLRNAITQSNKV